jgi:3-hexulose-6-phosphate synthase
VIADASFPASFAYVGVHLPTDAPNAGDRSTAHIDAVAEMRRRGFRAALAGGIGPENIDAMLAIEPEIPIIGNAITESEHPKEAAKMDTGKLINPGRGWPSDKK